MSFYISLQGKRIHSSTKQGKTRHPKQPYGKQLGKKKKKKKFAEAFPQTILK